VGSAEYTVVRTTWTGLWTCRGASPRRNNMDISAVRRVLDEDHYGLEKVKKRILEYLAVRKLKKDKKGPILCLIGPPGVGRPLWARALARTGSQVCPHFVGRCA